MLPDKDLDLNSSDKIIKRAEDQSSYIDSIICKFQKSMNISSNAKDMEKISTLIKKLAISSGHALNISSSPSRTGPKIVIEADSINNSASIFLVENSKDISSPIDVVTFKLSSLNISPKYFKSKNKSDHDRNLILNSSSKRMSSKSLDIFEESNYQSRERQKNILSRAVTDFRVGSCRCNLVVSEKPTLTLKRRSLGRFTSRKRMSRLMQIAKMHGFTVSTPTDSPASDGEDSTHSDDDEHYSD